MVIMGDRLRWQAAHGQNKPEISCGLLRGEFSGIEFGEPKV